MLYKVIVSSGAAKEIAIHVDFLARVNEKAAKKLKKELLENICSLNDMPQRNSFFRSDMVQNNKYRKMFSAKRYLILYQIIEDTVYVDFIIDCRQDYQWLLH